MMNKENILNVANAIEGETIEGLEFDMRYFDTCIATWSERTREELLNGSSSPTQDASVALYARKYLGLTWGQAAELFYAYLLEESMGGGALEAITREHAVRCLRHLADTGVVDWVATRYAN